MYDFMKVLKKRGSRYKNVRNPTLSLSAFLLKKALQLSQVNALKLYPSALSPHTMHFLFFMDTPGSTLTGGALEAPASSVGSIVDL